MIDQPDNCSQCNYLQANVNNPSSVFCHPCRMCGFSAVERRYVDEYADRPVRRNPRDSNPAIIVAYLTIMFAVIGIVMFIVGYWLLG